MITRSSHPLRVRAVVALLVAGIAGLLAVGPAATASASLGSVPAEVSAYVASGMVARLGDVYGKNASGAGTDFDATTKPGPISRVYEWTALRLRDGVTDHPVQLTNNWVVPITIGGKPVGLATIWINPQSAAPELASFDPSPALATAMASVPATAALVRDSARRAWLALENGTVTPLVAGKSGVTGPTPVVALQLSPVAAAPAPPSDSHTGFALAIGAVALVVLIVVVALLLPRRRRPRAAVEQAVVEQAVVEQAVVEQAPVEQAVVERPQAATPRTPPPKTPPPKASSPITKPAPSKPGGRASGASTASTRPRSQKPPAAKPAAQKPPAQKPPATNPSATKPRTKPPTANPRTPKPPPPEQPADPADLAD